MSLKQFVAHAEIWKSFLTYMDEEIAQAHRDMEQASDFETIKECQGRVKAYRRLKQLKERISSAEF